MLFYCREVFRRRSPAAALRAAAAVQQLAASQLQPAALTACNLLPGKLAIEISPVEIEDFSLPKQIFIVLFVTAASSQQQPAAFNSS